MKDERCPTPDDLPARLDAFAAFMDVSGSISPGWVGDVRAAAARLRELEADRPTDTTTDARIRRGYWATLADETERLGKHTITLTTGELRTLLMDAEQAAERAEFYDSWNIDLIAQAERDLTTIQSLRAEIQRLESLLRQG